MKHIISSALFLLILLCISVFVFDPTYLYYQLPWLDIPMHVLGGFGVVSFVVALAHHAKQKLSLIQVLVLYLVVAVSWEVYELLKDILNSDSWNGWSDTISDIINGAIGGTVAHFLFRKK